MRRVRRGCRQEFTAENAENEWDRKDPLCGPCELCPENHRYAAASSTREASRKGAKDAKQ